MCQIQGGLARETLAQLTHQIGVVRGIDPVIAEGVTQLVPFLPVYHIILPTVQQVAKFRNGNPLLGSGGIPAGNSLPEDVHALLGRDFLFLKGKK